MLTLRIKLAKQNGKMLTIHALSFVMYKYSVNEQVLDGRQKKKCLAVKFNFIVLKCILNVESGCWRIFLLFSYFISMLFYFFTFFYFSTLFFCAGNKIIMTWMQKMWHEYVSLSKK